MKSNYQPWEINIDDFYKITNEKEKLEFFLRFAALAPSAHNSQPWNFFIKDSSIIIIKNEKRLLSYSDPVNRQVFISIGCALENIITAADFYGFKSEVFYLSSEKNKIIQITFNLLNKSKNSDKNHLIYAISNRCTNRGKFKKTIPPDSFLNNIKALSSSEISVFIIKDHEKNKKDLIADLVLLSQIKTMDDNNFREELSHYIKSSFTKEKIGMPGFTLGVPSLISLFLPKLIKIKNISRLSQKKDNILLKEYSPIFIVIGGNSDSQKTWINAGRILERIWLMAETQGLACAPLAAPIEFNSDYKKLQDILKITMRPLVFFRMGYPEQRSSHSPRLSLRDILVHHL